MRDLKFSDNCRFKTEEEFEKEFGKNWRQVVPLNWVSDKIHDGGMDYLFGQPYDGIGYVINPVNQRRWSVSNEMLTIRSSSKITIQEEEEQIILSQE